MPSLVLEANERFKHPIWALEGKSSSGMKMRWRGLTGGMAGGKGNRIWEVALKKQDRGLDQGLVLPGLLDRSGTEGRDRLRWQRMVLAPRW